MAALWTPTPPPLHVGPPYQYSIADISDTSRTEAFATRIDNRDAKRCIVCGRMRALVHCQIVPKAEDERWDVLKSDGFIPSAANSVCHEPRNGILMCTNHHTDFDEHGFYIRWEPMFKRFIFINHSQHPENEPFHGRAVRLFPGDLRTPFYGAFIDQEMRVRGRYPYMRYADRAIALPVQWQSWITDAPDGNGGGGGNGGDGGDGADGRGSGEEGEDDGDMKNDHSQTVLLAQPSQSGERDGYNIDNSLHAAPPTTTAGNPHKTEKPNTITFRNAMEHPSELERMMRSARQQPSWKASVIEGESWEGTTEENINKYLQLLLPADET